MSDSSYSRMSKSDENEPFIARDSKSGLEEKSYGFITPTQAGFNVVKCAVGAGSLSLPGAFQEGGLYLSFALTIAIGALSAYTINILTQSERFVCLSLPDSHHDNSTSVNPNKKISYGELGRLTFPKATVTLCGGKYNIVTFIINLGIVLSSIGISAVFVVFISGTMKEVIGHGVTKEHVCAVIFPVLFGLSLLRSFKYLSFTSMLGNIAVTTALLSVLVYGFYYHPMHWDLPVAKVKTLSKFFGSVGFLFAIHIVVLPIAQSMREPGDFPKVVNKAYMFITWLNALFGAIAYGLFADNVANPVTDDLKSGPYVDTVKVLLCVDLLFTAPMVLAAGRELIEDALVGYLMEVNKPHLENSSRNITRLCLVVLAIALTFIVPCFNDMVNLVGGFANSLMGFILPPIIWVQLKRSDLSMTNLMVFLHVLIVAFGVYVLITSTYLTIQDLGSC